MVVRIDLKISICNFRVGPGVSYDNTVVVLFARSKLRWLFFFFARLWDGFCRTLAAAATSANPRRVGVAVRIPQLACSLHRHPYRWNEKRPLLNFPHPEVCGSKKEWVCWGIYKVAKNRLSLSLHVTFI